MLQYELAQYFIIQAAKNNLYLRQIMTSTIHLCTNHSNLLARNNGDGTERICQFRIAHHLANSLESKQDKLFIDCEFNKAGDKSKKINGHFIIPDIIFHNRNKENIFILEVKIKKTTSNGDESLYKDDRAKVYHTMQEFNYYWGYCLSEITPTAFTIHCISPKAYSSDIGISCRWTCNYSTATKKWRCFKASTPDTFCLLPQ